MSDAGPPPAADFTIIRRIMFGLIAWGAFLSLGAFLFRGEHDLRKPFIIMGCVAAFIGLWALALTRFLAKRRESQRRED